MQGGEGLLSALIVEDHALSASALERTLRKWFRTAVAVTGADALAAIERESFSLILVDIGLPDMNGLDVLHAAREKQPRSVRAALTGDFDRDLVHRVELLGATFMNKPAPRNLFERIVDRARALRLGLADLALHVGRMSRRWKLTPTEHNVLVWCVASGGRDAREEYCASFGVKASTFEWHVKEIRSKVPGTPSIDEIVHRLLLDVIDGRTEEDPPSP